MGQVAQRLAEVADPLRRLEPLELSTIGRQLKLGQAAVVVGPKRAAVISSAQLFPRMNLKHAGTAAVSFDQRFRGEQLIASTLRSLQRENMPMVVFAHAEERSQLRRHDRDVDLVGVATLLRTSRFQVEEWRVAEGDPPAPAPGQPVVWVVVPPTQRQGLELPAAERALLAATRQLLAAGEPVLLSVYPSVLSRLGRTDPWREIAAPMGLRVDTSQVVHEAVPVSAGKVQIERGVALQHYQGSHPIAEALEGQRAYFAVPVPIEILTGEAAPAHHEVIGLIDASGRRWLDRNWDRPAEALVPPPTDQRLEEAVPIVVAAERMRPEGGGTQRMILVGSGGWMLSYIADVAVNVGGDRLALVNPGNAELLLTSVTWLAGMDELIAPSVASREVARLQHVTDAARLRWFLISVVGLPVTCLAAGMLMWWLRRR